MMKKSQKKAVAFGNYQPDNIDQQVLIQGEKTPKKKHIKIPDKPLTEKSKQSQIVYIENQFYFLMDEDELEKNRKSIVEATAQKSKEETKRKEELNKEGKGRKRVQTKERRRKEESCVKCCSN